MAIEVVYINPERQSVLSLNVPTGATIRDVIRQSGLLQQFPEIDLEQARVGIYNELRKLDAVVQAGDRVEIYRPLQADPKEARRKRAEK